MVNTVDVIRRDYRTPEGERPKVLVVLFGNYHYYLKFPLFRQYHENANYLYIRDPVNSFYYRGLHGAESFDSVVETLREEIAAVGAEKTVFVGMCLSAWAAVVMGLRLGVDEIHGYTPMTYLPVDNYPEIKEMHPLMHTAHNLNDELYRKGQAIKATDPDFFEQTDFNNLEVPEKTTCCLYFSEFCPNSIYYRDRLSLEADERFKIYEVVSFHLKHLALVIRESIEKDLADATGEDEDEAEGHGTTRATDVVNGGLGEETEHYPELVQLVKLL